MHQVAGNADVGTRKSAAVGEARDPQLASEEGVQATQGTARTGCEPAVAEACGKLSYLLRKVAFRFARRLPSHVEVEELMAAGAVGLVTAVRQHQDKPLIELKRLAVRRIYGAMLDHLRAADHLTRRQRAAVGAVQRAKAALEQEGKPADLSVIASQLGMSLRRAQHVHDRLAAVQVTALPAGDALTGGDEDPMEAFVERESRQRVVMVLGTLPERLRTLLSLYYYEELTYQEISEVLGISRSRICQLHTQAITALRRALAKDGEA